jgi:ATP-dependent Clp protease ATP-binding subunit ClpA
MASNRDYLSRFTESGRRVLENAIEEARNENKNYVSEACLIKALSLGESRLLSILLNTLNIALHDFALHLEKGLKKSPQHTGEGVRISPEVNEVFKRALARARAYSREAIDATDIFVSLSQDDDGAFIEVFKSTGADLSRIRETVREIASNGNIKETSAVASERHEANSRELDTVSKGEIPLYKKGDMVRVKSGAFQSLTSRISAVDLDNQRLKLSVNVFNHPIIIELNFTDVEKLRR